jgi:asparagine synthase (glutamine-hydrolysing)
MCGLLGIYGPSKSLFENRFAEALATLHHRGPDATGIWKDKNIILGHNRLSIIDASSAANQPFQDKEHILVYNGEIYNHLKFRNKTIKYTTHSDTETLFHFLKQKDVKEFNEIEGMFAGAFYNKLNNELILFRDSLGIKPLYVYTLKDKTIIFASEIKAILYLLNKESEIDSETLYEYLNFENWAGDKTFFADIKSLKKGEIKKFFSNNQVSSTRIQLQFEKTPSLPELPQFVYKSIEESICTHLLSDVPLGSYLSGGIDSGIVTTIAARHTKDLIAFNGYFETKDGWYDESPIARKIAQKAKVTLVTVKIMPQDFIQEFDKMVYALDEPRMGMGAFSQFIVAKEVAKHRKVILSGHGGDELFSGYVHFKSALFFEAFPKLSSIGILCKLKSKELPWVFYTLLKMLKEKKFYFSPVLFPELASQFGKELPTEFSSDTLQDITEKLQKYYESVYIPGLLSIEDKISMYHTLETRCPLWSQYLYKKMRYVLPAHKLYQGELKGLLKLFAKEILPPEVLSASKKGFPTPLRHWFRKELRGEITARLLKEESALDSLVEKNMIKDLLNSHFNFPLPFALDEKRAHKIWMLLCLESWMRQYSIRNIYT